MAQILGSDLLALQRVEGISLLDVAPVYAVTVEELSQGFNDLFVRLTGDEMSGPLVINDSEDDKIVFDIKGDHNEDPDDSIFMVRKDGTRDQAFYLSTLDQNSNAYEIVNKKYVDAKIGGAIRYEDAPPLPPTFVVSEGDIWIDKQSLLMYVYDQAVDAASDPIPDEFHYVALTGLVDSGQVIRSEAFISESPPTDAKEGDLWFDSALGELRVYYTDNDSSQWVSVNNAGHDVAIDSDITNLADNVNTLTNTVDTLVQAVNALNDSVIANTERIEMLEQLNPNSVGTVTITGPTAILSGDAGVYMINWDGTANNTEIEFSSSDSTDTFDGFAVTFGIPGTRTLSAKVSDNDTPFESTGTLEVVVSIL